GVRGVASARMMFIGFGIAALHKFLMKGCHFWSDTPAQSLYTESVDGHKVGLKGAAVSGDLSPEMLGVGYLIGPRIASLMLAGAVISFFVLGPLIASIGEYLNIHVDPSKQDIV